MNLKLIAVIVSVVACIGAYSLGRYDGKKLCIGNAAVVYQEGVKNDANIEKGVQRLAESDLDRALSRWVQ